MARTLLRAWLPGMLLALVASQAWAEVTLTFYAHPGARVRDGMLLFPHTYVAATGYTDDTGESVEWAAGFTARNPGNPLILLGSVGGQVDHPDAVYVAEGKPYLRLVVSDATWRSVKARADWWATREGSRYNLNTRNCITFVADLARVAGLQTAKEPAMKPGRFLADTAALNPFAAVEGAQTPQPGGVEDEL